MDAKRDNAPRAAGTNTAFLQYGGQAVIEGVMMRSPHYFAVACRKPDGSVVTKREEVDKSIIGRLKWLNRPFLRGTLALIDAMALGTRALAFASNVQMEAEQQKAQANQIPPASDRLRETLAEEGEVAAASIVNGPPVLVPEQMPKSGNINDIAIGGTIAFSFVFGIALFVLLPTVLTQLGKKIGLFSITYNQTLWLNIVDGLIRMAIFFGYIGLISLMPQIQRVFQYHGAEHKAINTLEAGLPLTPDNALNASRIHPRCGTSFIFIVLVINLIVFAFLPRPPLWIRFPMHLAIVPLVAGIAYEVIKFAGKFRRNALVMAVLAPGMWSQYLTTREPDREQVEVALTSLRAVLEAEGHSVSDAGVVGLVPAPNPLEPEAVTA
ncbi:MAG TPA: DUF1385 domain-containing protein [Chthonomonadaceae bacterium]|nr:DUF1385 domain-containing protein [Chthonomonadaceae bacterium]